MFTRRKGFTLIELLIAMSIMLLMLGIAIAQYLTYDRRNNLILTADSVKVFLQTAKDQSQSREMTQGVDLPSAGKINSVYVKVDNANPQKISEYKLVNGGPAFGDSLPADDSFLITDKIDVVSSDFLVKFDSPNGKLALPTSTNNLVIKSGPDQIKIEVNENTITTTQEFQ